MALQRSHAYAYEVGVLCHDPVEEVRTWPTYAVPVTAGGERFTGGAAGVAETVGEAGDRRPLVPYATT
jgi:hypothetical protein